MDTKTSLTVLMTALTLAMLGGCGGGSSDASSGAGSGSGSTNVNAEAVKGALVFKKTCASCHGADARGMPDNGPDLHSNEFVNSNTDQELLDYVINGRVVEDGANMPPRGGFTEAQLPNEDIERVIAYIRRMPGNSQPAASSP